MTTLNSYISMNIHRIKINNISLDRYESELLDELLYVFIARLGAVLEPKYDIVLKHCDTFFRHCISYSIIYKYFYNGINLEK